MDFFLLFFFLGFWTVWPSVCSRPSTTPTASFRVWFAWLILWGIDVLLSLLYGMKKMRILQLWWRLGRLSSLTSEEVRNSIEQRGSSAHFDESGRGISCVIGNEVTSLQKWKEDQMLKSQKTGHRPLIGPSSKSLRRLSEWLVRHCRASTMAALASHLLDQATGGARAKSWQLPTGDQIAFRGWSLKCRRLGGGEVICKKKARVPTSILKSWQTRRDSGISFTRKLRYPKSFLDAHANPFTRLELFICVIFSYKLHGFLVLHIARWYRWGNDMLSSRVYK